MAIGAILALSAVASAVSVVSAGDAMATPVAPATTDSDGDGLTNVFERTRSHTDPHRTDTNGNGISDAREDPDRDGLTNIWEQRLGLDPLQRDSNGNGIADGNEDHDHDGLGNLFEIKGKVSDPRRTDTNGDGLPDSAEDPDHDGLSNLGEQRWQTNPRIADSNANGVPDGAEDANGNGVTNADEQDDRAVPAKLRPTLANARADLPLTYADGCHIVGSEHAYRHCSYGNPKARVRVALFGDSHASQWFPAVYAAAMARGWRVDNYTRSGCPSADVTTFNAQQSRIDVDCANFRRLAIASMTADVPTIVILTSRVLYQLFDSNDQPIPDTAFESTWDAGLARTLDALPRASIRLVLADTPLPWTIDVPKCLAAHPNSIAACEGPRATWISAAMVAGERATAAAHHAHFGNLNGLVCPYDPCGVIYGNVLVYRDISHITATFAASLAPSMGAWLVSVLPH